MLFIISQLRLSAFGFAPPLRTARCRRQSIAQGRVALSVRMPWAKHACLASSLPRTLQPV